jgi:poly-gamma-glutamate synthesis protein (capsule biosynthesis protein)
MSELLGWVLLVWSMLVSPGTGITADESIVESKPASSTPASQVVVELPHAITFVGDILLARDVELRQQRYGAMHPFGRIRLPLDQYVVANFESSIPVVHQPTPHFHMRFSSPTSSALVLRDAGVTHVSLANNHSLDFGVAAYEHTRATLHKTGVRTFGMVGAATTSEAYDVLETAHGTVAIIGLETVTTPWSAADAALLLAEATAVSDWQVVYIHWGPEYVTTAAPSQRAQAAALVASGADLIIGHHPHVVQDIELINSVPVFYSLGNFIFDQYFSSEVQTGLLVTLDLSARELYVAGVTSHDAYTQPRHHTPAEEAAFLAALAERSDPHLRSTITAGVIPFGAPVASSTKIATILE